MLAELVERAHAASRSKGWYDGGERNVGEMLALIHSEISEALEDWRNGNMTTTIDENGKPIGFPSEIADTFIRLGDLCGYLGISADHEVRQKMTYNATRAYRHGGKRA